MEASFHGDTSIVMQLVHGWMTAMLDFVEDPANTSLSVMSIKIESFLQQNIELVLKRQIRLHDVIERITKRELQNRMVPV